MTRGVRSELEEACVQSVMYRVQALYVVGFESAQAVTAQFVPYNSGCGPDSTLLQPVQPVCKNAGSSGKVGNSHR